MGNINQRMEMLVSHFTNGKQGVFAKAIGVSQSAISDLVSGRKNNPSFDVLTKIRNTYPSINMNWLVTGEGEMIKEINKQEVVNDKEQISMPKKLYDFIMSELDRSRRREDEIYDKLKKD